MLHKIALAAASLVAALVLAGGLALAGFGPARPLSQAASVVDAVAAPADAAGQDAPVQVDTIYLTPEATPAVIEVTQLKEASRRGGDESERVEHEGDEGHDD